MNRQPLSRPTAFNTCRSTAALLTLLLVAPPLLAESRIDERRPLAANASVEVQNMQGSIVVTGGDGSEIVISGTLGEGARKLLVEGDENRLRIKVDYPDSGGGWGR